jgi:hypothetical protein
MKLPNAAESINASTNSMVVERSAVVVRELARWPTREISAGEADARGQSLNASMRMAIGR